MDMMLSVSDPFYAARFPVPVEEMLSQATTEHDPLDSQSLNSFNSAEGHSFDSTSEFSDSPRAANSNKSDRPTSYLGLPSSANHQETLFQAVAIYPYQVCITDRETSSCLITCL